MLQYSTSTLANDYIFRPANTGSPRQDVYNHLSQLSQSARVDFEEHTVVGNLIIRIEPDLGSPSEHESEAKIVSIPYAERVFGNPADANEFIRCIKQIAGSDARPFNLQIIASHYYREARTRSTCEVLKEMAILAMELSAVSATEEDRRFGEPVEFIIESEEDSSSNMCLPISDRRAQLLERAALVLGETEHDVSLFDLEKLTAARFRSHASSFVTDEFAAFFAEQEMTAVSVNEVDELYETYETVYEQYDEDGVVSLHMTDNERVIVAGSLDDDIDENSLPEEARHLAGELYNLYTNGFPVRDLGEESGAQGMVINSFRRDHKTNKLSPFPVMVYGLDAWLDLSIDLIYKERVARTVRNLVFVPQSQNPCRKSVRDEIVSCPALIERTKQGASTYSHIIRHNLRRVETFERASRLHEQTSTMEICPSATERETTRAVLEVLLDRMKTDSHTRALHANSTYRHLITRLEAMTDTAQVASLKQEAWEHKEQGRLSVKLFTAFNTQAGVRGSALETEPYCEHRTHRIVQGAGFTMTQTYPDEARRKFIVAQPVFNCIQSLTGKTLNAFAVALHNLPRQERERIRRAFQERNERLYSRVRDGLRAELLKASVGKLRYFRWAFYPGNKPEHPVHTLTREDQMAMWELLKSLSGTDRATSESAPPLLAIAEATEKQAIRYSAVA